MSRQGLERRVVCQERLQYFAKLKEKSVMHSPSQQYAKLTSIAPPRLDRVEPKRPILRELNCEEYDNEPKCDACVEGGRKDVVVSHPPTEVEATHEPLEGESGHDPGRVIDTRGRWHGSNTSEEHGYIDVSPEREGVAPCEEVEGNRGHRTNEEEPQERVVPGH